MKETTPRGGGSCRLPRRPNVRRESNDVEKKKRPIRGERRARAGTGRTIQALGTTMEDDRRSSSLNGVLSLKRVVAHPTGVRYGYIPCGGSSAYTLLRGAQFYTPCFNRGGPVPSPRSRHRAFKVKYFCIQSWIQDNQRRSRSQVTLQDS